MRRSMNTVTTILKHGDTSQATIGSSESFSRNEYLDAQFKELLGKLASNEKFPPPLQLPKSKRLIMPHSWPERPLQPHPLSQAQAVDAYDGMYEKTSMKNVIIGYPPVQINFLNRLLFVSSHDGYKANNLMLKSKFYGDKDGYTFYSGTDDSINAGISLGYSNHDNKPQGFLVTAKGDKLVYWELEEFSMVSSVKVLKKEDQVYRMMKNLDDDRVVFICFSKTHEILYADTPKRGCGLFDGYDNPASTGAKEQDRAGAATVEQTLEGGGTDTGADDKED